ncbi:MAG TPA: TIGR01777 family oxidoreductase [Acidobacteriaceae bacterium]|nr:TIGR01777 family oxidoreductase [Acidobacteriaceae bacterium]
MSTKRFLLTGSSGFIGTSLVRNLDAKRIPMVTLSRSRTQGTGPEHVWDPYAARPMTHPSNLEGVQAAVHLSGANVSGRRWTPAYRREILESRVKPTHALATLLAGLKTKPEVLVCASAIGIYGDRGNEVLSEDSPPGCDFLAEVCAEWEYAAQPARDAGIRVVHTRFGVVLSPNGGALKQMLPVFRCGLGGPLGSGRQWVSWITLADAIRAIEFAVERPSLFGAVNVASPNPVMNREFARALGRALHRPAILPAPAMALRMMFGEMAQSTILASQRVMPAKLTAAGFEFGSPEIAGAFGEVLSPAGE